MVRGLLSGYYNNLPPFSYNVDSAAACYMLGYCTKIDYDVAKAKYEWANKYKIDKKYEFFDRI